MVSARFGEPLPRVSLSAALSRLENRNHFAVAVLCSREEDALQMGDIHTPVIGVLLKTKPQRGAGAQGEQGQPRRGFAASAGARGQLSAGVALGTARIVLDGLCWSVSA